MPGLVSIFCPHTRRISSLLRRPSPSRRSQCTAVAAADAGVVAVDAFRRWCPRASRRMSMVAVASSIYIDSIIVRADGPMTDERVVPPIAIRRHC